MHPKGPPFRTRHLDVGDGHNIYIEENGTVNGLPVIFLHGGPGVGCEPWYAQYFDPAIYHIILFDQRGAGKSTPHASLEANTTQHLLDDIELIRTTLGIEQWLIFGGSWGSTLALAYTQSQPQHVLGLILRGIFLCREQDINWFYQSGASRLFPEFWQDFLAPIPESERDHLIKAYYQRLTGSDKVTQMRAAEAWSAWEIRTSRIQLPDTTQPIDNPHLALSMAKIECHYFINHGFLCPNQLLENAHKLHGIPGIIVHGRYDCICPIDQAYELKSHWPDAEFHVIPDAGHSMMEPGISKQLLKATQSMARKIL